MSDEAKPDSPLSIDELKTPDLDPDDVGEVPIPEELEPEAEGEPKATAEGESPAEGDGGSDGEAAEEAADQAAEKAVVGTGEQEVDCPGCGLTLVGESPRPTAAWFCPRCDYPLFWAADDPPKQPPSRKARRRLPGTGGLIVLGAEPCWHCGEMLEPDDRECGRCAAVVPKPLAPTVLVPEPYPEPVPVSVRPVTWPYIAAAACAGSSVAIVLTLWATGSF